MPRWLPLLLLGLLPAAARSAEPLLKFDVPQTIVCLGDSVTGVYYHTGGYRAYPEMLEIALKKLHPDAPLTVINAGISGHTTQNGLDRLEKDVLSKQPTLVTVSFGLNDVTRIPPEQFRKNLEQITAECRKVGAQVVLCTPNAVLETGGRPRAKIEAYNQIIREVGQALKAPVCDQYAAGEAHRARDAHDWRLTLSDEIHPNMDGHKLMAEVLCETIAGKKVALGDVAPPSPALRKTLALLKEKKPVRVLAMPPYDGFVAAALKELHPDADVTVTPWPTGGKTLSDLERESNAQVRKLAPNLVVLAIPREAQADSEEQFIRSYTWVLNWSLSFGLAEWDCVAVHPAVAQPDAPGERDDLARRLIRAQHIHLIDRPEGETGSAETLFKAWLVKDGRSP